MSESGTSWRKAEADAIRRHHAPLFEAWKRQYRGGRDRLESIPGFRGSLQSLLDQGYIYADIARMIGVSPQRVRQWCEGLGMRITHRATMRRVWDDELMRFRPVTKAEYREIAARCRRERWEGELERRQETARQAVRAFAAKHGRPPTVGELASLLFPGLTQPQVRMRNWLAGSPRCAAHTTTRLIDHLFLNCGFVRPDGRAIGKRWAA